MKSFSSNLKAALNDVKVVRTMMQTETTGIGGELQGKGPGSLLVVKQSATWNAGSVASDCRSLLYGHYVPTVQIYGAPFVK